MANNMIFDFDPYVQSDTPGYTCPSKKYQTTEEVLCEQLPKIYNALIYIGKMLEEMKGSKKEILNDYNCEI